MSKMSVFSVFDKKAERFLQPFFMVSAGEAIRAFQDLCADQKTVMFRHPEDFKLVRLCEFDEKSGSFLGSELVTLSHASDFSIPFGTVEGPVKLLKEVKDGA